MIKKLYSLSKCPAILRGMKARYFGFLTISCMTFLGCMSFYAGPLLAFQIGETTSANESLSKQSYPLNLDNDGGANPSPMVEPEELLDCMELDDFLVPRSGLEVTSSADNWEIVTTGTARNRQIQSSNNNGCVVLEQDPDEQERRLQLFRDFAKQQNSFVRELVVDSEGNIISIRSKANAETWSVRLAQQLCFNHTHIIDAYYLLLQKRYGPEIAEKAFPQTKRQEAAWKGLQSSMVFDTLKTAILESVRKLRLKLDQQRDITNVSIGEQCVKMLRQLAIEPAPIWDWIFKCVGLSPDALPVIESELINSENAYQNLDQFVKELEALLEEMPDSITVPLQQPQSIVWQGTDVALKMTDFTMMTQSSCAWLRRAIWVFNLLKNS